MNTPPSDTPTPPPPIPQQAPAVPAYVPPPTPQPRKRGTGWLWFFLITSLVGNMILFLLYSITEHKTVRHEKDSVYVERHLSGDRESENKIAVIRVEGVITSGMESDVGHDGMVGNIKEQLRIASKDENIKAIILRVDSPGGEVLASDEIYRAVKAIRDGTTEYGKKPVICSMGSVAASGGFYAAMGTDWIIADNLTITGSIGVIMHTINYQDLFGKIGLKSIVFKSGKFKDLLNGGREPTPDEIDLIQDLVMETYDQFADIVAKERKLDSKMLRETLADGRIFSGKQALQHKLIDETGDFDDAIARAKKKANISDADVVDYVAPFSLSDFLGIFAKSNAPRIELNLAPEGIKLQQGKLYYISPHLY